MSIVINRTAVENLKIKKAILKQFYQKNFLVAALFIIMGLVFMFGKVKAYGQELPFWNVFSAIGLAVAILGLFNLRAVFLQRANILKQPVINSTITINENAVIFKNNDIEIAYQWSYFKYFNRKKSLLFLKNDLTVIQAIVIDENNLNKEQKRELEILIASKFLVNR